MIPTDTENTALACCDDRISSLQTPETRTGGRSSLHSPETRTGGRSSPQTPETRTGCEGGTSPPQTLETRAFCDDRIISSLQTPSVANIFYLLGTAVGVRDDDDVHVT